mmetsp:Transcript_28744/g.58880  ORF Transcript_28744/g.58880 Transcript_28744/m.58880 type:complete len:143 (+) Transcript_28744:441-869(+)
MSYWKNRGVSTPRKHPPFDPCPPERGAKGITSGDPQSDATSGSTDNSTALTFALLVRSIEGEERPERQRAFLAGDEILRRSMRSSVWLRSRVVQRAKRSLKGLSCGPACVDREAGDWELYCVEQTISKEFREKEDARVDSDN